MTLHVMSLKVYQASVLDMLEVENVLAGQLSIVNENSEPDYVERLTKWTHEHTSNMIFTFLQSADTRKCQHFVYQARMNAQR